jgi:hypothetical protein
MPRHAKRCDHATIGRENLFRLQKYKDWSTVEFVETINLISLKERVLHDDSGNASIDALEWSKSA